jgi:hypothetical protein
MKESRWIYFIQLGKTLPEYFFQMSHILNKRGIKVLPVSPDQFFLLYRQQYKVHAIIATTSVGEQLRFNRELKPTIKQLISGKLLSIYHLSSFNSIAPDFNTNISLTNYVHVKLPVSTNLLSIWIAEHYKKNTSNTTVWPGGRRAKLPDMGA